MSNFHVGDPVLIINGRDALHLSHVGKGTIVVSEYIKEAFQPAHSITAEGYLVDLSKVKGNMFGVATDLLYRSKDLMPINPLHDEDIEKKKERQKEKAYTLATRFSMCEKQFKELLR